MERILNLAMRQVDAAEVFSIEKSQIPVLFKRGRVAAVEQDESFGVTLRVIKKGRIGFSSSTKPGETEELIARAVAAAKVGPEGDLKFPGHRQDFGGGNIYDPVVESLDPKRMIEIGYEMHEIIKSEIPELEISCDVSRTLESVKIMNSMGGQVSYRRTVFQAFLYGMLVLDNDRAELEHTAACTHLDDGPQRIARQAVWRFKNCRRSALMPTKKLPVIFSSLAFRGLYVPLYFGLNGEHVLRKTSRLTDMIGQRIADPSFTVADDPTMPMLTASCPVDDEGTPTARRELIKNGILTSYIYDLTTAAKAGVPSTGNGYKKGSIYEGFKLEVPPSTVPSSFVIEPGDVTVEEMIRSIDEGLIVDDTIGAGQGNNLNGEFAVNVSLGYKIEKGEIVGRVKDVMVAGNIYDLLKRVRSIGAERTHEDTLFGRYYAPWTCFDDLSVASS